MTVPRTQDHRHWVFIELAPNGESTGGIWVDLNLVDKVEFAYGKDPKNPVDPKRFCESAVIIYAGTMKPILLANIPSKELWAAAWFHEKWEAFITAKGSFDGVGKMDPAKPGLILVPGKGSALSPLTGDKFPVS